MSLLQYLLQRAHLFFIILLFESTFVAHHGPFPLLLGTQPLCFLPPYVKGNTQSSVTPSSLPNVLPWPSALQMVHSPVQIKKNWLVVSEIIKHYYSTIPHDFIWRMKILINKCLNWNPIYNTRLYSNLYLFHSIYYNEPILSIFLVHRLL